MASRRQVAADHKAQSRAVSKRNNEIITPLVAQPDYQVPEADEALRATMTASWDTASEIKILRFFLAKCAQDGTNPLFAVQLTKAIDTMISRNQATALKCGAYLSRDAISDFIRVLIHIACEAVREHAPDQYEPIIDDMREKLTPYFDPAAIAAANARHDQ